MKHEMPPAVSLPDSPDSEKASNEAALQDIFSQLKRGESAHTRTIARLPNLSRHVDFALRTPYGERIEDIFDEGGEDDRIKQGIVTYLKEKLKGQPLIDLGGDDGLRAFRVGTRVGAAAVVSVDRYLFAPRVDPQTGAIDANDSVQIDPDPFTNARDRVIPSWRKDWIDNRKQAEQYVKKNYGADHIPDFAVVCDDMLDFVARLPDNSTNFMINGIDDFILRDPSDTYQNALAQEMVRSLKPGGVVFGSVLEGSMFHRLENLGLRRRFIGVDGDARHQSFISEGTVFLEKPVVAE